MKLIIKVIHAVDTGKPREEIEVECADTILAEKMGTLLDFEHWLNTHTKARFHIDLGN